MRAAEIFAEAIASLVEALGMVAENDQRKWLEQPMAYGDAAFTVVAERLRGYTKAAMEAAGWDREREASLRAIAAADASRGAP